MDTIAMQCVKSPLDILDSLSLNRAPLHMQSPSTSMASAHNSPMGSSTQLSKVGSNSALNDFPEAEEFLHQERSKSLDSINIFGIPQPGQKRRSSLVGSRNALTKKPR